MTDNELYAYTAELVKRAGIEDDGYTYRFVAALGEHPAIRDEYIYYLEHGSYSCTYTIEGCSIADIIIWQMDNFKALLDNADAQNKGNPYKMTLLGFDTMMKMADDPGTYISKMHATTGTDYLGKY